MNKLTKKIFLFAGITTLLTMTGSVSATNGYFAHAYSQKEAGLAGAGSAKVKDVDALTGATNPANMVFAGDRWDLGIALFNPDRSYTSVGGPAIPASLDPFHPIGATSGCAQPTITPCQLPFSIGPQTIKSDNQLFPIPSFGWNKMLTDTSSIGVMIYGNGGMNTEYQGGSARVYNPGTDTVVTAPGTYGAGTAGVDLMQLFVAPTYSVKVTENSSVGVSLIGAFQRFKATGLSNFAGVTLNPTNLSNNGYATSTGFGLKLGFNAQIIDGLRFAASYQSEIKMSSFDEYSGLFAEGGDFDIPETWTIGIAADVGKKGTFVLDLQRINYDDIAAIANGLDPLFTQCLDALNSVLFGGSAVASGPGCGGGINGFGFGWDDMSIVKVGYEWDHSNDWTFRAGYSITDQPIGSDDVVFNILAPAVIESHLTAGFTKQLSDGSEFTMSFMYGAGKKVKGTNPFDSTQTLGIDMDQYQVGFTYSRK